MSHRPPCLLVSLSPCLVWVLALWLLTASAQSQAAGLLEQVPRDALGVLVVRNLSQVDARAAKLLDNVGVPLPGPLQLLKSLAGIDAGLDASRDLLIIALPADGDAQPPHLALWLPVDDYDEFVRSLEGDPQRQIATVTMAGEDLFVTRHGDWAVVVDPVERERLERLHQASAATSRSVVEWEAWAAENDLTLVALPSGVRTAWAWYAKQQAADQRATPGEQAADDLFGPMAEDNPLDQSWAAASATCRMLLAEVPDLERWLVESRGVGCGLKLDEAGSIVVGLRMILPAGEGPAAPAGVSAAVLEIAPPLLPADGDFMVVGSGWLDPRWTVPAVTPYVRHVADDLENKYGIPLDDEDVAEFRRAVEPAVADVQGFALLTRPGKGREGVFTNNFLAVRVASDETFLEHAAEAMRRWNQMTDKDGAAIRLVFDSNPVTIGARQGTEHAIDMAHALGAPALPDLKQSMEGLFGPGGKFRLQFVSVDSRTVLLAAATQDQAAGAIASLGKQGAPIDVAADQESLRVTNRLLAESAAWRVFFSPHDYNRWLKRQMDAVLGPVIGGPVVRDLAASPPIGAVGGLDGRTAWIELALPAETLKAISKYAGQ